MSGTADPGRDADAGWRAELQDPRPAIPSGTSVRFAVLVLVVTASTGSIFGYLWQLSRPDLEARTQRCLASFSSGPLAKLIARLTSGSAVRAAASAACVRPDGPALTAWSLAGIGILLALSLALYLVTPWWIIKVGWPGSGRLRKLDPVRYRGLQSNLDYLADTAGVPRPAYYVNWAGHHLGEPRAFGYRRRPCIRLNAGLLVELEAQATRRGSEAVDVLLHELAHLRNRDNLPTYLTLAAWRAFAVLLPAAYLVMLAISGVRPANPGPRIIVSVAVLVALVLLSSRAVIRSRELHADATAAYFRGIPALGLAERADPGPAGPDAVDPGLAEPGRPFAPRRLSRLAAGWRQARSYHPSAQQRAAALRHPERLYRPDPLAMASAGVAIAIIASELTPALFSALLSSVVRPGSALLQASGPHPLVLILVIFGPAALLTSILVVALASATARRREHLATTSGASAPASDIARLALPMAAGMLAGIPLSFDYVLAGTWGTFDTGLARNLIVAAMSAVVLAVTLLAVFGWASESAAAWFSTPVRRPRLAQAVMLVTGVLGLAPPILAWAVTSGLPLTIQILTSVDVGQQPYIGRWPAAAVISTHVTALGAYDIVPGGAVLLALPCLFVAVRSLRPAGQPPGSADGTARVPVATVLITGLTAAGISVAAGLALMLSLHSVIGAAQITRAGGYGLLYLNRVTELEIAACAGAGAALVARRAGRARLTSGILTALVTATAAAVFVPKLLFLGELRWGYRHVNPAAYPTLYGIAGNMTPGKAVAAALLVMAASGAAARLAARRRRRGAGTELGAPGGPAHATVRAASRLPASVMLRLAAGLGFAALITGLTLAGYFYFTSYT
jgi:Zn-dependent protease with chaperone function